MILASKSPRRKEILEEFGFKFKVEAKETLEKSEKEDPKDFVMEIALEKAMAVAEENYEEWIIAADTVVVHNNKILGKPKNEEEARAVLKSLSSHSHEVYTGVAIVNKQKNMNITFTELTKVYFKNISDQEINWYVETKEPLDKAGSYGIQGKGSVLIEKIEGDFYNVMGFPISKFYEEMKKIGFKLKEIDKY
ncbi:MAG: septum formation inhibitor Maf [Fusobacteriaceae bacterium]|nr:septum formation inhibitor Maf [Fusobacteriaceae bacterium]MBN2837972.1 septum formation inhibitor Maf [Fusobacteriaceae bacterium]